MNQQEFLQRIEKYLGGKSTEGETEELFDYYKSLQGSPEWNETELGSSEETEKRILQKIKEAIQEQKGAIVYPFYKRSWFGVAAAVFVLLCGSLFWLLHLESPKNQSATIERMAPSVANKTVLELTNGKSINVDEAADGVLASLSNAVVRKEKNKILFQAAGEAKEETKASRIYNKLTVPKGRQYEIVLGDGSHVWLNAVSSLQFPTVFKSAERRVEVQGEAYFEVAKNKQRPFRVLASAQDNKAGGELIEVLGTHFNIKAYGDEEAMKTTLLEGSVKVSVVDSLTKKSASPVLSPGQQAQMAVGASKNGEIVVAAVDVGEAIAWTTNKFNFNNTDLPSIMRELARWYGVDVVYEGRIPQRRFSGTINRSVALATVLKILEQSDVHFRVDGKRIVVTS